MKEQLVNLNNKEIQVVVDRLFIVGGKAMNNCPYCSCNLLPHLRSQNRYWYCPNCRSEISESFITAQNRSIAPKFELFKSHNLSLVSSL